MSFDQMLIMAILLSAVAMFVWGRWRHDMVALGALIACVLGGLVGADDAFAGFGHPAVITVACVLVLSRGLQTSGAIDVLTRRVLPAEAGPTLSIAVLTALAALLSGFMNNVGALALLMPVGIQLAARLELPAGKVLMPLAFGSILGGTMTLVGTPPNLIVSGFRDDAGLGGFGMFSFAPVGLPVTLIGVAFIAVIGWRLVPARKQAGVEGFESGAYFTEARVTEGSKAAGKTLAEIEAVLEEADAQVLGLVRNSVRMSAPHASRHVLEGDILVIEAEAEGLSAALGRLGLKLEEDKRDKDRDDENEDADGTDEPAAKKRKKKAEGDDDESKESDKSDVADEIVLMELAVLPASNVVGRSANNLSLRTHYGINLLAVSRQGRRSMARLRTLRIRAGDLLLMQGPPEALREFASSTGCVPLAQRELRIRNGQKVLLATGIIVVAVAIAALGLLPASVSFAGGVLASMALRTVPPREAYEAIDWPVIVLLGALIPVAGAMETTGTANLVASFLLEEIARGHVVIGLVAILVVTMTLSDLMNNAATAAVMCPIALGSAAQLGVSPDPFLMAVALGASCAFLTPIGHQNNTLILGPGGFRFGDYWRLGLPLELFVVAVGIPMILWAWPP